MFDLDQFVAVDPFEEPRPEVHSAGALALRETIPLRSRPTGLAGNALG